MKQPSPQQKHDILRHIRSRRDDEDPVNVAAQHGVYVDRKTIWRWQQRWNGTSHSLEHKIGAGRHRILTATQVSRLIRQPILAANRAHRSITYTSLHPLVKQKTHTNVSIRTIRRYAGLIWSKEETGNKANSRRESVHTTT